MSKESEGWSISGDVKPAPFKRRGESVANESSESLVLGPDCKIQGSITLEGQARVNGVIEGELIVKGQLFVGESARINASIFATAASIQGTVLGNIKCDDKLALLTGANVQGDLVSPSLTIQDGVNFEGRCSMPKNKEREDSFEEKNNIVNLS